MKISWVDNDYFLHSFAFYNCPEKVQLVSISSILQSSAYKVYQWFIIFYSNYHVLLLILSDIDNHELY